MFHAVQPLSKYLQQKSVRIYDGVFTLHAKCTCALLLAFTFLLSSKQYFGDPIVCISDMKEMDFVNTHCWTMGMYIIDYEDENMMDLSSKIIQQEYNDYYKNRTMEETLLSNAEGIMEGTPGQDRVYLRYYQWVVPVLLLQSFIFYLPAFLWKIWEGGRLKNLCGNLNDALASPEKTTSHLIKLAKYFGSDFKETHMRYHVSYILCEFFNLAISIVNMLLLNVFLDNFWSHYVKALAAVPAYNWLNWTRITTHIFPKIAKCQLMKFGSSGTLEYRDNLCLLPLNVLNEKIFVFLWVWFILIAVLAAVKVIYRLCIVFHRGLRFMLVHAQSRFMPKSSLKRALSGFSCGDWFLLMRVSNNISPEQFSELLNILNENQQFSTSKSKAHCVDNA